MKRKFFVFILTFALMLALTGCNGKTDTAVDGGKKIIAVSIVPQATFVEKVCGDNFEIVTMIPPGASPETYEPTPVEMQKLEDSSVYFSIGVPAEETSILSGITDGTKLVKLHEKAAESYPEREDDGGRDPHVWLSPKRVKLMVSTIRDTLCELDSANAELYKTNAESYIAELDALDKEIRSLLGNKSGGKFIAFHPAFGYFADDYGLTMYALEEHGKEATAKSLAQMVDLANKEDIKVIFYQEETSGIQAEAFAEEIGGKAVSLEPLAADYTANLKKMAIALSEAVK